MYLSSSSHTSHLVLRKEPLEAPWFPSLTPKKKSMECRKWCPLVWPLDLGWQWHSFFTHDETLWHRNACLRLKDGEEGMPINLSISIYPLSQLYFTCRKRRGGSRSRVMREMAQANPWKDAMNLMRGWMRYRHQQQQQPGNLTGPSLHAPAAGLMCPVQWSVQAKQSQAKPAPATRRVFLLKSMR